MQCQLNFGYTMNSKHVIGNFTEVEVTALITKVSTVSSLVEFSLIFG